MIAQGAGGYFDTSAAWREVALPAGQLAYGARGFPSRAALRAHVAALPPGVVCVPGAPIDFTPSLLLASTPRITLVADTGRQIAHYILDGVIAKDVEYL